MFLDSEISQVWAGLVSMGGAHIVLTQACTDSGDTEGQRFPIPFPSNRWIQSSSLPSLLSLDSPGEGRPALRQMLSAAQLFSEKFRILEILGESSVGIEGNSAVKEQPCSPSLALP